MRGLLVFAAFSLAAGLGLLFGFCHGSTGASLGSPLAGASVHVDITTTGIPAVAGLVLTGLGALLLAIATLMALAGMARGRLERRPPKRRENAFEE